jgi:hypothetical protein
MLKRENIKWLIGGLAACIGLAVFNQMTPSPPRNSQPIAASSPSPSPCVKSPGSIWVGVRLYTSPRCEESFAYVLGGGKLDGEKYVKLQFANGEIEWKKRSVVLEQTYVLNSDRAIKEQRWLELPVIF